MDRPTVPHPAMLSALRACADARGLMSYRDFTATALFHPELGYYRRNRRRVGQSAETDFATASSVGGETFGALIASAARTLLGGDAREYTLVEIGAEPGRSIFEAVAGDFAGLVTLRVGEPLRIPPRAVVFANELFDAQPFVRLRYQDGAWRELGVHIPDSGVPEEVVLPAVTRHAAGLLPRLAGVRVAEGHTLDVSPEAQSLLDLIVAGDWRGAVIFPDYGKTLAEFLNAVPAGTARAYHRHTQSNDLTDAPGERDLTCHVAWDLLEERLVAAGFTGVTVERQESFLMKRATPELERRFGLAAARRDVTAMETLKELVHPARFGAKFQVLSGVRR